MSSLEERKEKIDALYRQAKGEHVVQCPKCRRYKTRPQWQPNWLGVIAITFGTLLLVGFFWFADPHGVVLLNVVAIVITTLFLFFTVVILWVFRRHHVQCTICGYRWDATPVRRTIEPHIMIMGRHVMILASRDLSDELWTSNAFVPLVVFYSLFLQYLHFKYEWLQTSFHLIGQLNIILGIGISIIIFGLLQKAAEYSKNDLISGPIQQFNLYTFFFIGLLFGGIEIAIAFTILYYFLERLPLPKTSISPNEWHKFKRLGTTRRRFILSHYVVEPLVGITTMIVSFWVISWFIPVELWLNNGWILQIKFLTLHVALWKLSELIITSLYDKIVPTLNLVGIFLFLITFVPAMALTNTWLRILFYVLAYSFVWFVLIQYLVTMNSFVQSRVERPTI